MRLAAVLASILLSGCSSCVPAPAEPDPRGGLGELCDTDADCLPGLTCRDERCAPSDRPRPDGGPRDGGADGGPRPDAGPPVGAGCSADLRSVLAADGSVLFACPPADGCAAGRCIPACEAAAASRGNVGCRFVVTSPPALPSTRPPCLAAFVANTWVTPANVRVSYGATDLAATAFGRIPAAGDPATWPALPATGIPVDDVAVLFLSSDPESVMPENGVDLSCPIVPAVDASTVVPGTGIGTTFRIETDVPVSAYDILPFGGARSHFPGAQLLLPTSAWGTQFVVIGTPPGTHSPPGPIFLHLAAGAAPARVEVRPTIDLPAGPGVPAAPAATTTAVEIAADTFVQWELPPGAFDPSGTLIVADTPIAVIAGNRFFRHQPMPAPGGESTHQPVLPISALAHEYVAAPFETRRADLMEEAIPHRFVGVFAGTTLTFDPPIPGAPATLEQGQVVDFLATGPFRVASQDAMHPFAAAQIMPTANVPGGSRPGATDPIFPPMLGDEEMLVLFPPAQFLSRYVFFTDPTYATTSLAVTRVRGPTGFAPVTIDCLGELSGWRPAGTDGRFETTTVDLVRADVGTGTCTNGRHLAESAAPFGITVWGLDTYASYAYPAGGNAATLAELPPLF